MDDALAHHARQEEIALVIEPDEVFENDPERDAKLTRRRLARERVLQVLYARSMNGKSLDELYGEFISSDDLLDEPAKDFAAKLLRHFSAHEGHINDVIKHRLEQYREKTEPLIDYYEEKGLLHQVDGSEEPSEVEERIHGLIATLRREEEV